MYIANTRSWLRTSRKQGTSSTRDLFISLSNIGVKLCYFFCCIFNSGPVPNSCEAQRILMPLMPMHVSSKLLTRRGLWPYVNSRSNNNDNNNNNNNTIK